MEFSCGGQVTGSSFIYRFRYAYFHIRSAGSSLLALSHLTREFISALLFAARLQAADPSALTPHLPVWQSCILLDYSSCRLLSLMSGSSSHQASVMQFPSSVPSAPWWEWLPSVSGPGHLNTPH